MKRSNRGTTSLKSKGSSRNPMREFDRLPPPLRSWVAGATLPWRARSVQKAYDKALARTGDPARALRELDRLQMALVSKDAERIWGQTHPEVRARRG